EWLHRAPAAMQEIEAAGQDIAPRRHARQAADIVPVEGHATLGQPVEVRRRYPRAAVWAEQMPIERIEQHEHSFHFTAPCVRPRTMKRWPISSSTSAGRIESAAAAAICV